MTSHQRHAFRVLSYNIFLRPPGIYNRRNGDYKEARMAYFIEHVLPKYDILAFQELFSLCNTRQKRLIQAFYNYHTKNEDMKPLELHAKNNEKGLFFFPNGANFHFKTKNHHHHPYHATLGSSLFSHGKPIDSGLCILSRYPIVDVDYHIYKHGMAIDSWSAKGCLGALIQVEDNAFIFVVTTHLQADYNDHRDKECYRHQIKQFEEMRDFVAKKNKDYADLPLIATLVLGDLNIDSRGHQILNEHLSQYNQILENPPYHVFKTSKDGERYHEILQSLKNAFPLQWINLVKECIGHHPITFGDVKLSYDPILKQYVVEPKETTLSAKYCEIDQRCLDYMFLVPYSDYISKSKCMKQILPIKVQVEPFLVQNRPFSQLSDHCAIDALLSIEPITQPQTSATLISPPTSNTDASSTKNDVPNISNIIESKTIPETPLNAALSPKSSTMTSNDITTKTTTKTNITTTTTITTNLTKRPSPVIEDNYHMHETGNSASVLPSSHELRVGMVKATEYVREKPSSFVFLERRHVLTRHHNINNWTFDYLDFQNMNYWLIMSIVLTASLYCCFSSISSVMISMYYKF